MKQRQIRMNDGEYYELVNKTEDRGESPSTVFNPPLIDTTINEGDTLQSLSIRYHCPVAELKRINNILRENEIFARRTIKVPFRPFTMVHKSGDSSPNTVPIKKSVNPIDLKQKLATMSLDIVDDLIQINGDENIRLSNQVVKEASLNDIIFNTKISETSSIAENDDDVHILDEEVQLIPGTQSSRRESVSRCDLDCSGSDWGLSWPLLLTIVLIIAFIGPLIYIFYIYEHPEEFHHYHNTTYNNL